MAVQPDNNLVRVVALCPPSLVEQIEALVAEEREHNPGANRSLIVRRLLLDALRERHKSGSGVRAAS
jgi:hypothetical protein